MAPFLSWCNFHSLGFQLDFSLRTDSRSVSVTGMNRDIPEFKITDPFFLFNFVSQFIYLGHQRVNAVISNHTVQWKRFEVKDSKFFSSMKKPKFTKHLSF